MAMSKSDEIYEQMRTNIENGKYPFLSMLPSEHRLTAMYACSRTTVRRALSHLVSEGYVQTVHGKGVQVLYQPRKGREIPAVHADMIKKYLLGQDQTITRKLLRFEETVAGKELEKYHIPAGSPLYHLQMLCTNKNQIPVFYDRAYIRADLFPGITHADAERSVLAFYLSHCHGSIVTSRREMHIEPSTRLDQKMLDLGDYQCVASVISQTFNKEGVMIAVSHTRYHPRYVNISWNIKW